MQQASSVASPDKKFYELRREIIQSLGSLATVLSRDGFVIFICGPKESGKTDIALLLAQCAFLLGFRRHIATNIKTNSYMVEAQVTDLDTLNSWLSRKGRKLFVLDEAGKSLKKMRFMSEFNLTVMDTIQTVRKYDCGFIGIAPNETFIDSNFLNTDILDAKIKKFSKTKAQINDYLNRQTYILLDVPRTSVWFDTKDIAKFTRHAQKTLSELPLCCAVARVYAQTGSYSAVSKAFENMNHKEIRRHLRNHLKHCELPLTTLQEGIGPQQKEEN